MKELLVQVVGGLVVVIIAAAFGLGSSRHVIYESKPRKSGKIIILISVLMIFSGLAWANSQPLYGFTLAGHGLLFLIVGKVVAWFQRP